MDSEQVRRLVGNDNCIVIFVDEGIEISNLLIYLDLGGVFDPLLSSEFGVMPQFFVVVQPFGPKYRYSTFHHDFEHNLIHFFRVGGYYRKNVGSFNPMFTKGLLDREDLLDFVLAKCEYSYIITAFRD